MNCQEIADLHKRKTAIEIAEKEAARLAKEKIRLKEEEIEKYSAILDPHIRLHSNVLFDKLNEANPNLRHNEAFEFVWHILVEAGFSSQELLPHPYFYVKSCRGNIDRDDNPPVIVAVFRRMTVLLGWD